MCYAYLFQNLLFYKNLQLNFRFAQFCLLNIVKKPNVSMFIFRFQLKERYSMAFFKGAFFKMAILNSFFSNKFTLC